MKLLTLMLSFFLVTSCQTEKMEEIEKKKENFPIVQRQIMIPILRNREVNEVLRLNIVKTDVQHEINAFTLEILKGELSNVSKVQVFKLEKEGERTRNILFGESKDIVTEMIITGLRELSGGGNNFIVSIQLKKNTSLLQKYKVSCSTIEFSTETVKVTGDQLNDLRVGIGLRQAGDDNVAAFRIPGLVTTNKGTIIGVYDVRRNSSVDLQGDIDIGVKGGILNLLTTTSPLVSSN